MRRASKRSALALNRLSRARRRRVKVEDTFGVPVLRLSRQRVELRDRERIPRPARLGDAAGDVGGAPLGIPTAVEGEEAGETAVEGGTSGQVAT